MTNGSYAQYAASAEGTGPQGMLWTDTMTYLPDDILVKVDRMTMAASLEARAPLLDHVLVEFVAGLPRSMKYDLRHSKILLRQVARDLLPPSVLRRSKQGFAVPLARWLREDLRGWCNDLLTSPGARTARLLRREPVEAMLRMHGEGRRDYSQQIWAVLMLEVWAQSMGADL